MNAPSRSTSTSSTWADGMKDKYSAEVDERHRLEDVRVAAAQSSVSKQVNKLKRWILKIGGPNARTTFGELFDAVQGDMAMLSGTLKSARRMGVVQYEGEHLLQGRDNAVVITLLDTDPTEREYTVVVREKGSKGVQEVRDPFALDALQNTTTACYRCHQDVLPQERVGVAEKVLHRKCFECYLDNCTMQLTPARYASLVVEGELRFYCIPHYKSLFKTYADYTRGFVSVKTIEVDHNLQ
jgi:hypothetical protein